jgi:DNA primase
MKSYAPEIWICYDGDEPGQIAALRALDILHQEGIAAKVIHIPGGEDPDEFIRTYGHEAFHNLKPLPAMTFRLSRLEKGFDLSLDENKREFARQACQILHLLSEPVETDYYLGKISMKTGIAKEVLAKQMQVGKRGEAAKQFREPLLARKTPGLQPKADQSEITLAALLASGFLPGNFVMESDFEDPQIKAIVNGLLNGKSPAVIMDELESEGDRIVAGDLFNRLPDLEKEEALSAAEDCLKVIRASKINQRISTLNEEIRSQEGEQKLLTLQLIRELRTELERYNKYIVR